MRQETITIQFVFICRKPFIINNCVAIYVLFYMYFMAIQYISKHSNRLHFYFIIHILGMNYTIKFTFIAIMYIVYITEFH